MDQGKLIALDTPSELVRNLQSDSAVEFKFNDEVDIALSEIDGVKQVGSQKDIHVLYTDDLQKTLTSLIAIASEKELKLVDLQTRTATLEDVFIHMTGRRLREG